MVSKKILIIFIFAFLLLSNFTAIGTKINPTYKGIVFGLFLFIFVFLFKECKCVEIVRSNKALFMQAIIFGKYKENINK